MPGELLGNENIPIMQRVSVKFVVVLFVSDLALCSTSCLEYNFLYCFLLIILKKQKKTKNKTKKNPLYERVGLWPPAPTNLFCLRMYHAGTVDTNLISQTNTIQSMNTSMKVTFILAVNKISSVCVRLIRRLHS